MSQFPAPASHEEAAAWFAMRRRGVMTLEERASFAAWRTQPANDAAMAELERAWELLEAAEDVFAPAVLPRAPRRHRIARSALLAAACAVFLGLGVISYSGTPEFWTALDWVDR